jgi:hypothetical protein
MDKSRQRLVVRLTVWLRIKSSVRLCVARLVRASIGMGLYGICVVSLLKGGNDNIGSRTIISVHFLHRHLLLQLLLLSSPIAIASKDNNRNEYHRSNYNASNRTRTDAIIVVALT